MSKRRGGCGRKISFSAETCRWSLRGSRMCLESHAALLCHPETKIRRSTCSLFTSPQSFPTKLCGGAISPLEPRSSMFSRAGCMTLMSRLSPCLFTCATIRMFQSHIVSSSSCTEYFSCDWQISFEMLHTTQPNEPAFIF